MDDKRDGLLHRVNAAERELDEAVAAWRREAGLTQSKLKRFSAAVRAEHRQLRRGLIEHIRSIGLLFWLSAPFIYALIVPLALLDLFASLYQFVCFPVYGITRIRRSDYIVIDRHRLSYLNLLEKLNCVFCGYANGVIAYARELAGRTEQYFCPIKHALKVPGTHSRYSGFVDYGDAKGYRDRLEDYRRDVDQP